jgi:hypothetical protein
MSFVLWFKFYCFKFICPLIVHKFAGEGVSLIRTTDEKPAKLIVWWTVLIWQADYTQVLIKRKPMVRSVSWTIISVPHVSHTMSGVKYPLHVTSFPGIEPCEDWLFFPIPPISGRALLNWTVPRPHSFCSGRSSMKIKKSLKKLWNNTESGRAS